MILAEMNQTVSTLMAVMRFEHDGYRKRERGGGTRLAVPSGVQSDLPQGSHSAPEYRRGEQEVNFTQGSGSGKKVREANVRKQPELTWYLMAGLAIYA